MAPRRCKHIRWGFLQVELQVEILKDLDCNLLVQYSAYPCKSTLFKNDNSCINIYLVKFPGDKTHIFNTMSHEGDCATADTEFHLISAAAEARSCTVILF